MEEIRTISLNDKEYPEALRKIAGAPKVLYLKGKLLPEELCFAIVGTRRCSAYGKQAALEIAGGLAEAGLTIVSGLAPGIDTFSHSACVERNKRTIAVLGTGLDEKSIYPQSNLKLTKKILETGGCLVSELPPNTSGSRFTFPNRNRIIAGLSLGTLVIEAKEKSGALITADYAFSQKKKVFALPGSIYSQNSKGPHKLIKRGAKLVESANDILKELSLPQLLTRPVLVEGKTSEERLVLEVLKQDSLPVDKIIEKTKLNAQAVSAALALLEISGKIRNLGGNTYAIAK